LALDSESRVLKRPWILEKSLAAWHAEVAEHGVDVLLRGDHHPGAAAAGGAKVLGDGLQVEHQVRVLADELADLVGQEDDAVALTAAVEVAPHPLGEVLDGEH
jgi:hypothetical protein